MALRLYTKEEFETELREQLGLDRTETVTDTSRVWKTKKGFHVLVPLSGIEIPEQGERYPDSWLAGIYKEVTRLDSI